MPRRRPNLRLRGRVWYWRAMIKGRRYCISTGFKREQSEAAARRASELERDVRAGLLGWAPKVRTYDAACGSYLKTKACAEKAERALRPTRAVWGARRLDQVTAQDCAAYLAGRSQDGYASNTIRVEAIQSAAVFRAAARAGEIRVSPWQDVKMPRERARARVLTPEQEVRLRAACSPEYERAITVLLGTGLRSGELLGLQPDMIDYAGGWICLPAELCKGWRGRRIPLRAEVAVALREQAKAARVRRRGQMFGSMRYRLLPGIQGAAEAAGIPWVTVHDLRRTFATRCATAGVPMPALQAILGHSAISVTARYYVHLEEEAIKESVQRALISSRELATRVVSFRPRSRRTRRE